MYDVEKSTFLYHSDKFVRNYPDFTIDGEYMLGKFGWGYSREGGGEYSPSTGTCLFQVDTGKEIWCREEVLSQEEAYLSEKGGVIAGEKALYDFFSGKKIMKYPQFAKSGDKTLIPQRKNMAIIIRAMSPDGRYFVATEGRCDPERIRQAGKESGCSLGFLRELKTYLGEWEKGDIKRIIRVFSENWDDVNLKPFYFLTDGRLVVYSPYPPRIQLMNVSGEVVAEISNDKASNISQLAISRLQPRIDYSNRVVVWPSADEKDIWRVYGLDGRLVGEFAWKEPQGRESHVRRFAMINDREYIFTVDIVTKKRKTGGTSEYISEVYRGEFQPGDRGR
ncbi:MAG: hypothetical protein A2X30_04060 [Elusimicrobia bacterium GWB2_63_16]|nr:MAG: hypothetical protein A2X30_04060 [Elusimicrobia bacterium GWB2_63_16]